MTPKKDAINALLKGLSGTLAAAGFEAVADETNENQLVFAGDIGDLRIAFENNLMTIFGNKGDDDEKELAKTLFDPDAEDWNDKDTASAAADVAETVAEFFGVQQVNPSDKKSVEAAKKQAEERASIERSKKKKAKKNAQAFDDLSLAYRMETIFPELAGKADENVEAYGVFLPEEYFETYATPLIVDAFKKNNKQTLKKISKSLITFYEEGEKNTQSLVAVSILGMSMAADPELEKNVEGWLGDDLGSEVGKIVTYLKKSSGKKAIKRFKNPVPYKESTAKKAKSAAGGALKKKMGLDDMQRLLDSQDVQKPLQ